VVSSRPTTYADSDTFTVVPTQSPYLTVSALLLVLLVLFIVAYLESVLRAARRRKRVSAGNFLAAAGLGVLLGVVFLAASWMIGRHTLPTRDSIPILSLVLVLLFGGTAGLCLMWLVATRRRKA
jgi:serine/threonine-protein kinase